MVRGVFIVGLFALTGLAQTPSVAPKPQVARPQPGQGQLDSNETLFTVLAAIHAGGYNAEIDSPSSHPLRKTVRDHFAKLDVESVAALKRYVRDHKPRDPNAELSQYISWALLSTGPPSFSLKADFPAPPDAASLDNFALLISQFYQEANIASIWKQVQPYYDAEIERYHEPVTNAVLQVNAYLRNVTSGYVGRRFQMYIDVLGAPNQVQTRNYVDDYYVVVTPAQELPIDDIRHAYLHYLLDPVGIKFADDLKKKQSLNEYAQNAPALSELYKGDFVLMATESLLKAIEGRLDKKPDHIQQALREGFVLAPAFDERLAVFERQEQAMRLYFPDLVSGIDVKREQRRLESVQFANDRAVRSIKRAPVPEPKPVELTGAAKSLDQTEQAIVKRDTAAAKESALRVLSETDQQPLHARAYYGLARVALLERDPETADRFFRKVLELNPDASTQAWTLLYLGKLADSQGESEEAHEFYQEALAVAGVPDQVKSEAQKGLKNEFLRKQEQK